MPKRKTAEVGTAAPAEPKKRVAKPRAATAAHKHASTKKPVESVEPVAETPRAIGHDDIARLAYSYWEQRGFRDGSPEQDWLRAETELLKLA